MMAISRQHGPRVRGYSVTHPPGRVTLPSAAGWDHVLYAHRGVFTASSATQAWTIPAHRAICVPADTGLRLETPRRTAIRCLYLDADLHVLDGAVRVITLQPLARELLAHAVTTAPMDLTRPADAATITLLADLITSAPEVHLRLPLPSDPTARSVAEAISSSPGTALDDHIAAVGASRRTLERRFLSETQLSLGRWRRRARILQAVTLLADGHTVTAVAIATGYASPSSFVAAFRAELGVTPTAFAGPSPTRRAAERSAQVDQDAR
jgi:AraC-like DNA-binding protein